MSIAGVYSWQTQVLNPDVVEEAPEPGSVGAAQYECRTSVAAFATLTPAYPLLIDSSLYSPGAQVQNAQLSAADLVLVDLAKRGRVDQREMYSKAKISPFEGWELVGMPVMTILRGQVIMADGRVTGEPGFGRFISAGYGDEVVLDG